MALTKAEIIEAVQDNLDFSISRSTEVVETFIEIIKQTLEVGEDVLISGFGKFCVKQKNKRKGRNPSTGEEVILPARSVVTFRCSSKLRKRINM